MKILILLIILFLLIAFGGIVYEYGYDQGNNKGYQEGLDDASAMFRSSLVMLNKRIKELEERAEQDSTEEGRISW